MKARTIRPVVIALAASFALWAGCGKSGPKAPQPGGYIGGGVSTTKGGGAVPSAAVVLVNTKDMTVSSDVAVTDSEGKYRIGAVPPGRYTVLVLHDSLVVQEKPSPQALIRSNKLTTYDIGMVPFEFAAPGGYRIRGAVTDAETSNPIAGAYVGPAIAIQGDHDRYAAGFALWSDVTDSLGRFDVPAAPLDIPAGEGLIPITVTKQGYEPFTLVGDGPSIPLVIPPMLPVPTEGNTLEVAIPMRPLSAGGAGPHGAGSLKGRLVSFGEPLPGVLVGISLASVAEPDTFRSTPASHVPIPQKTATTDSHGEFEVTGLTPGYYWVDPAFPQDDGYVMGALSPIIDRMVPVAADQTSDVGVVEVGRAMKPVAPANRATIQGTTPQLRWTSVPLPPGMEVAWYDVQYSTGYVMDKTSPRLKQTRWRFPESETLSPGDVVRWEAMAHAYNPAVGDTVVVGEFEWPATFKVAQ